MASVNNTTSSATTDPLLAKLNGNRGQTTNPSATSETEDRFLTLLTTQLKNQDPLNPLDNAQVTTQLAQINTVNGIEKLNATLSKLLSAYDDSKSMQAASMIGKNVLAPGKNLTAMTSGGAAAGALLEGAADKVTVSILDSAGKVVKTQELGAKDAGSFTFVWDGKDSSGNVAPTGKYTFTVEASRGDKEVKASELQIGTVSALVRSNNGFKLDLGDAGVIGLDDVQQIF